METRGLVVVGSLGVGKTRRRRKERVRLSEMPKVVETTMHKDNVCKLTLHIFLNRNGGK